MRCIRATDGGYRFLVLCFNCLLTFGSYFCFDMPSVLQGQFQGNLTCNNQTANSTDPCGENCLGMSPDQYNLLYAIYAWTNAVVVIAAGFLIDKCGNRIGVFLFSLLCVLGSVTFAAGAMLRGTVYMLPIMLTGRLLFGSGNGALTIVQNRITAFWFKDKELALAFGCTLALSRLGSVLNFFVTENFADAHGIYWTLWGGAILCGLGFISAIIVSTLDKIGVKQLGLTDNMKQDSKRVKFTDFRYFSVQFWLLVLTIMFFYNGVFPFVADASEFMQDKYNYKKNTSSYIAGAAYDVSMLLSPFLGGVIDIVGKRGILAVCCAVFTLPVFGLLAFSYVLPVICIVWLGLTYSIAAASMWPSIPLVVHPSSIGTAMGFTTSVQMIGIGICNLVVGSLLGTSDDESHSDKLKRWQHVMIFLFFNTIACVITATLLNIVDWRRGGVLNMSRKDKRQLADMLDSSRTHDTDDESVSSNEEREPTENDPLLIRGNRVTINA